MVSAEHNKPKRRMKEKTESLRKEVKIKDIEASVRLPKYKK